MIITTKRTIVSIVALWFFTVTSTANSQTPISRAIPADLSLSSNLTYAKIDDLILELDLFRPAALQERLPVVILVQGGGATNGAKETFGPFAAKFAEQGFAAISIDYRGYRQALFPATIEDVQDVIDWVAEHQDEFLLDADRIAIFGGSYGGLIAIYAGLQSINTERWASSRDIDAIISFSGVSNISDFDSSPGLGESMLGVPKIKNPQRWEDASSINFVEIGAPPLLLVASDSDTTVPKSQSDSIARKYGEVGAEVELHILTNAHHAFWNYTEWSDEAMSLATDFLQRHLLKE